MKKNKQAPLLSRWWHYKYSGLLTFAPIIILSIVGYIYMMEQQEFFTAWSCETISNYMSDVDVPERFPMYDELTDDQVSKIDRIYDECNIPFSPPK